MGNFIENVTSITCQSCQRAITKQPNITDEGWTREVAIFKEHHENCNGVLMNRIAKMLEVRLNPIAAIKTAGYIHLAITTGQYNDMLGEQNHNSQVVFTELTGVKLPKSTKKIRQEIYNGKLFTGQPFTVKE